MMRLRASRTPILRCSDWHAASWRRCRGVVKSTLPSGALCFAGFSFAAGYFGGTGSWSSPVTWGAHLPMLVFELTFATWLLIKGVARPARV